MPGPTQCSIALLQILLCLPNPLQAAKAPIRLIGSLGTSPPVAPFANVYNPLVPCSVVTDTGKWPCNRAGYPSFKAWMTNLTSGARGTVKFTTSDYRSRTVLAHPDELELNFAVWRHLDIDFVTMRNEYLYVSGKTGLELESFTARSPYPWVVSDFLVDERYPYLAGLLDRSHVKVVDGVKIGILVLWTSSDAERTFSSFPHAAILPVLVRRLRQQGVDQIVALRTGRRASKDDLAVLTTCGIDIVVTDVLAEITPSYVRNGTTVLVAPFYVARNDLLVLDMVQDGSMWRYSLRVISLHERHEPFYSNPAYLAAKQWIQGEMDRSTANNVVVVNLTAPMSRAADSRGGYFCNYEECEIGVLTADAMREQARAELALFNAGSVRAGNGWPVGPLRGLALWAAYPFANAVCQVNVSATMLLDMLNTGIGRVSPNGTTAASGRFPQISGFRFTMNTLLPVGSRVVSVDVMQPDGTFAPLEKRRVYSLATSSYLLGGGSGYSMLAGWPGRCLVTTMLQAAQAHLRRRPTYAPYIDGRIVNDFDGVALSMRNQSLADCSENEKHDAYWQDCVPCGAGFWRPDRSGNVCIEKVSESLDVPLIAGIIIGAGVAAAVPVALALAAAHRAVSRRAKLHAHALRHAPRDAFADIAVVFTDIKRSTDLWVAHHAEMTEALQQHHRICRELIEAHCGYEVKTIGDAFMVAFISPVDAVAFMLQLQLQLMRAEWPSVLHMHPACRREDLFKGLRVRAGAHCGPANIVETPAGGYDYDGITCSLASRVSDSGDGGQVIVTEELYRAVEPHLDLLQCVPDVRFLGSHLFKGVPGEVACYQILPDQLSGRLFDSLRNVRTLHRPSQAKPDADSTSSATKAQLTRAMQALRLWVTRDPHGVPYTQLNALLAAGVNGDPNLQHLVSLAVLRAFASRLDGTDGGVTVVAGALSVQLHGSMHSWESRSSRSAGSWSPAPAVFRWPVVSEILWSLPADFVLVLEGLLGAEGTHSEPRDHVDETAEATAALNALLPRYGSKHSATSSPASGTAPHH